MRNKTVNGVFWSSVDRFSTQGIQFVFNILIARILLPEDYGVVAMLNIFLAVCRTFIDSGFSTALIRKIDRTETDFCTVFYFNIAVSVFFYLLLWVASPYIAGFYDIPLLEDITKVVSLTLVLSSLSGVHRAKLSIEIDFKSRAYISVFIHAFSFIPTHFNFVLGKVYLIPTKLVFVSEIFHSYYTIIFVTTQALGKHVL